MACDPFQCERCGNLHTGCKGHVLICPEHGRPPQRAERARLRETGKCEQCGADAIDRPCERLPRVTQSVCPSHGGNTLVALAGGVERAERTRIQRIHDEICDEIGLSRDVDPGEALIGLVREAAANVEFYRLLVQDIQVHPEADSLEFEDGKPVWTPGDPGIYGRTYHQSGIPTGEAKRNILYVMYDEERDRLAKYSDMALRAGVEERRVRLAESDAREFFDGIGEAMKAAALTPEQTEVFRSVLIARLRHGDAGQPVGPAAGEVPARSGPVGD